MSSTALRRSATGVFFCPCPRNFLSARRLINTAFYHARGSLPRKEFLQDKQNKTRQNKTNKQMNNVDTMMP